MSDVDPTPSTPVTLGDRMAWWRGDQVARLNDMAARLNAIQTELQALNTTISSGSGNIDAAPIVAALEAVQGVDGPDFEIRLNTIRSLHQELSNITFYTSSILPVVGAVQEINDRLDAIQSVLGAEPYASTETGNIRALLLNLFLNQHPFGILPDSDDRPTTDSVSTITTAGWRYAVWSSVLPSFAVSEQGIYIRPDVHWDGYQIYIKTDAPSVYMENRTNPEQSIPEFWANTWWNLTRIDEFGWRMPSVYNIRAYLRGGTQIAENMFVWEGDDIVLYNTDVGSRWQPYHLKYPNDLIFQYAPPPLSGNTYGFRRAGGTFAGWQWQIDGGSNPQALWFDDAWGNMGINNASVGIYPAGAVWVLAQTYGDKPSRIALVRGD